MVQVFLVSRYKTDALFHGFTTLEVFGDLVSLVGLFDKQAKSQTFSFWSFPFKFLFDCLINRLKVKQ